MIITEKSISRLTAEEHTDALLNLAVPSPIFNETEPIFPHEREKSVERDCKAEVK